MTAASVVRLALPLRGFAGSVHDRCSPGVPVVVSSVTDATLCMKCARRSLESPATSFAQKKRLVSDLKIVASSTAACTRLWTDGTMWASIPMVLHGVVIRSKAPIDAPFAEDILDLIEAILVCCPCEPQLLKTLEGLLEQPIGCFESVPLTSFIECLALRGLIFIFRLLGGSSVALPISTERRLQQIVSACIDWRLPVETQAASCTLLKGILSVQSASQAQRPVASLATDSNFIDAFGRVSHSATRQLILECVVSLIDIAGSLPDQVVIEYCKALEITLLSVDVAQTEYSVVALANIVAMSPQACIISTNACEYLIQCLTRALSLSSHACGAILGSIVLFSNLPHFSANATAAITALAEQLRNWVLCDAFGLAERCIQALSEVVCNCDSRIMTSVRGDDVFDSIMRCTDAAVSATALLPSTREWLLKMLAHILDDYCPSRSAQDSINSILFTVWNALIAEDEANVADILSLCCKLLQNMVAMWHADGSLRFVLSFCEEQLVPLMALRPSWATLEFYDSAFAFLVSTMNRVPLETAQLLDNLKIAGIFDIVNELVEFETVQTGLQEFVIWSLCSSPPFKDDDTAPDSWKSRFPTLASLGISRICGVLPTCSSLPDVVPYCTMLVHRMRSLTAMPASTLQTAIAAISSILARIDRLLQREQPVTSYDVALNVAVRCVLGVAHLQRVAGDDIVFATSSSGGLVLHSLECIVLYLIKAVPCFEELSMCTMVWSWLWSSSVQMRQSLIELTANCPSVECDRLLSLVVVSVSPMLSVVECLACFRSHPCLHYLLQQIVSRTCEVTRTDHLMSLFGADLTTHDVETLLVLQRLGVVNKAFFEDHVIDLISFPRVGDLQFSSTCALVCSLVPGSRGIVDDRLQSLVWDLFPATLAADDADSFSNLLYVKADLIRIGSGQGDADSETAQLREWASAYPPLQPATFAITAARISHGSVGVRSPAVQRMLHAAVSNVLGPHGCLDAVLLVGAAIVRLGMVPGSIQPWVETASQHMMLSTLAGPGRTMVPLPQLALLALFWHFEMPPPLRSVVRDTLRSVEPVAGSCPLRKALTERMLSSSTAPAEGGHSCPECNSSNRSAYALITRIFADLPETHGPGACIPSSLDAPLSLAAGKIGA